MAYLHADNVLHGDLTAGNILLTSSPKDSRQFTSKVHTIFCHKTRDVCGSSEEFAIWSGPFWDMGGIRWCNVQF